MSQERSARSQRSADAFAVDEPNDSAMPGSPQYNKQRANLIQSTISVVLSKVYAKNSTGLM